MFAPFEKAYSATTSDYTAPAAHKPPTPVVVITPTTSDTVGIKLDSSSVSLDIGGSGGGIQGDLATTKPATPPSTPPRVLTPEYVNDGPVYTDKSPIRDTIPEVPFDVVSPVASPFASPIAAPTASPIASAPPRRKLPTARNQKTENPPGYVQTEKAQKPKRNIKGRLGRPPGSLGIAKRTALAAELFSSIHQTRDNGSEDTEKDSVGEASTDSGIIGMGNI